MKIVLALGGNALQMDHDITSESQYQACQNSAKHIVNLIKAGHDVAVVHGNGPQVGEIIADIELAHQTDPKHPLFPFDVCSAFTQGYIGYHLQNALLEALAHEGIDKAPITLVTQVQVSQHDPAFSNPSKPIGSFYSQDEAIKMQQENGFTMMEDAGRGWRRVVPSPSPIDIVEKATIQQLVNQGNLVIACGGGGIPVVKDEHHYQGVEAVIDKDFAAAKLAEVLQADMLIILTAVDQVAINFNQLNEQGLDSVSNKQLDAFIQEGQFAKGSMLPKVQAAKAFVEANPDKKAVIANLHQAGDVLNGAGTSIFYEHQ